MSTFFSRLAVLSVVLPFVAATNCGSNQFWYSGKSSCVPLNGQYSSESGSAPYGVSCPSSSSGGWYWSKSNHHCAPSNTGYSTSPSCPSGSQWSESGSACIKQTSSQSSSGCARTEFWWSDRKACMTTGSSTHALPPSGSKCPSSGWSWNSKFGCCAPQTPPSGEPQCPGGWKWISGISQCQPYGPATPTPSGYAKRAPEPSGYMSSPYDTYSDSYGYEKRSYPSGYPSSGYQSSDYPSSDYATYTYGKRDAVPSGYATYYNKRNLKSRTPSLCPAELKACPIEGATGLTGNYECLDTAVELTSCGGCASTGDGQDCTAIQGARNVGCVKSACVVFTCASGLRKATDGKSCIPL